MIENYRSCFKTEFECHPHLSVLIGPNGSGKTNVLQSIMLLNKLANQEKWSPFANAKLQRGLDPRLVLNFNVDQIRSKLVALIHTQTDESNRDEVTQSDQKWTLINGEKERFKTNTPLAFLSTEIHPYFIPSPFSRRSRTRFPRWPQHKDAPSTDVNKWSGPVLSRISTFCQNLRYYSATQFTNPGRCPVSFEIEREGAERKSSRLSGHAKLLYDMYSAWRSDESSKFGTFFDIVGPNGLKLVDDVQFKEVKISSASYTVKLGGNIERRKRLQLLVIPQFKIGRQVLSPNQLSEGTFKTLALLFYIVNDSGSALLIEEPEVCIHHGLLSSVLTIIKSYSQKKQILISTHSDYVLNSVKPENVFRVNYAPKTGTSVHQIKKTMTNKEYAALRYYLQADGNLGEYWREGGFEELR